MAIYLNILGHLSKDTFLDLFLPYYRISIRLAYYKTPEESEIHSLIGEIKKCKLFNK